MKGNGYKSYLIYFSVILNACLLINLLYSNFPPYIAIPYIGKGQVECIVDIDNIKPSDYVRNMSTMTYGLAESKLVADTVQIVTYDFSRPLADETRDIPCAILTKAKPPYYVCLHNSSVDSFSSVIVADGGMEPYVQDMMKSFFDKTADAFYFDLGMNIGTHSLYAALSNPNVKVLGVEPFPKNVIRGHKAAHLNKVQDRIQVVMAAISNKRSPVDFTEVLDNTGANTLINPEAPSHKDWKKAFSSYAITFNDLLPFVPGKKCLLKIDIEAQECYAFFNADKIFANLDIPLIIMEHSRTFTENPAYCVEGMLNFLKMHNYAAYHFPYKEDKDEDRKPLVYEDWRKWGDLYVWFKKLYNV